MRALYQNLKYPFLKIFCFALSFVQPIMSFEHFLFKFSRQVRKEKFTI